jgi:hypothetical protein
MPKKEKARKRSPRGKALAVLQTAPQKKKEAAPAIANGEADNKAAAETLERERKQNESRERLARLDKNFPIYYDARDGSYWCKPKDRFLALSTTSIARHMKKRGIRDDVYIDGSKEIEFPLTHAETEKVVDYTGSLAGYPIGVHKTQSKTLLVTEEPEGIWAALPDKGEPKFFIEFAQELLPDEQHVYFFHWLSIAVRSLRNRDFKPGQAVFFAGPAQCGKSLMQKIITVVLGGRSASPFKYMFGSTDFNYDLITAEHWMFEDPPTSIDIKTRLEFGERLKECCNNDEFRAHRKQKDAMTVRIFRRVTGSINSQAEHLARVPPLLDGTDDKVFLFKCARAVESLKRFIVTSEQQVLNGFGEVIPAGQQNRALLLKTIEDEAPLIRSWLLRCFKDVPPDLIDHRMGIRAWQHPELLAVINGLAPESYLLNLIDQYLWDKRKGDVNPKVEGRASEIERELRDACRGEIDRLCKSGNTCGRYLGRLADQHPERVSSRIKSGVTVWTINPPPETKDIETEGKS